LFYSAGFHIGDLQMAWNRTINDSPTSEGL